MGNHWRSASQPGSRACARTTSAGATTTGAGSGASLPAHAASRLTIVAVVRIARLGFIGHVHLFGGLGSCPHARERIGRRQGLGLEDSQHERKRLQGKVYPAHQLLAGLTVSVLISASSSGQAAVAISVIVALVLVTISLSIAFTAT